MPVPTSPQDLINIIREKLFNNTSGLIEEPDLREVLENIVKVLDAKFSMFSPNLTEEQFAQWNLILDYMANETKGVLSPTSPAPTEKGKYLLSSAGTYTNLGGLVATADKLNYAYFDGTTWSLVSVEIPEISVNGKIEIGNSEAVTGDTVNAEFEEIREKVTEVVLVEDYGDANNLAYTTSTFSGFGFPFGIIKNFNRLEIKYKDRADVQKATKMWIEIREETYDGVLLYYGIKDLAFADGEIGRVSFSFPTIENIENKNLWIGFSTNGKCDLYQSTRVRTTASPFRYTTYPRTDGKKFVEQSLPASYPTITLPCINFYRDYSVHYIREDALPKKIIANVFPNPSLVLPSKVWLYPNSQYNIFTKNVLIPDFGDNITNYRLNYEGSLGQQFERGFRINNVGVSLNSTITLNLMKGRNIIQTKTHNLLSSSTSNGTGVNRKVLVIGDSTVDGGDIHIPLKSIFDADAMDLTFIGTRGTTGLMHEGRGGWTLNDYYGFGRKLYSVPVSGISVAPSIGSVYKQSAGNNFKVVEVNITSGTGYFKVEMESGSVDLSTNGTLTKQSGSGDSTINYTGSTIDSANPFYNASTGKFDIAKYLTNSSQSLSASDWVFFQLGINDMFSFTTKENASLKVDEIITQLNFILGNINSYNSSIRIGIVIPFPPANQDAFGSNYSLGQLSELYKTTGLLELQKRLIDTYDNDTQRALNRFLVSAHLNLDTDYNFPSSSVAVNSRNTTTISMQSNGVHPDTTGNAQIADMYAGIIKYFG